MNSLSSINLNNLSRRYFEVFIFDHRKMVILITILLSHLKYLSSTIIVIELKT